MYFVTSWLRLLYIYEFYTPFSKKWCITSWVLIVISVQPVEQILRNFLIYSSMGILFVFLQITYGTCIFGEMATNKLYFRVNYNKIINIILTPTVANLK